MEVSKMSTAVATGSQSWWETMIDKTAQTGLAFLGSALGVKSGSGTSTASKTQSTLTKYAPYILGGVALVGVVLILKKR